MRAETVITTAAWVLGSAVVLLVACYWVLAPLLAKLNGDRFTKEARDLAEAEEAKWQTFRETGEFPDVDEKTLKEPGWQNALITEQGKAFR